MTKTKQDKFWFKKRVCVTGASGFLGKHFVRQLKKRGAIVRVISKDRCNLVSLSQTVKTVANASVVINCAAIDGNAEFKVKNAAKILDRNIKITSNILNACIKNDIKDVVLISSAEIYSPDAPNPIKEEDDYQKYDNHISNGYILSKRYSEILANLYAGEKNLRIYLPRPTNIYGPLDHFGASDTRAIPNFIKKLVAGESVEIWGDGSQIRQFIYVKDVVRIVLKMVEKKHTGSLNIANQEAISVLNLAKKIFQMLGSKSDIVLKLSKEVGAKNRLLDTSKQSKLISHPMLSLDSGLQKTITWYKKRKVKNDGK